MTVSMTVNMTLCMMQHERHNSVIGIQKLYGIRTRKKTLGMQITVNNTCNISLSYASNFANGTERIRLNNHGYSQHFFNKKIK